MGQSLRDDPRGSHFIKDLEVEINYPHSGLRTMLFNARNFDWEASGKPVILLVIEDITTRKKEHEREKLLASEQAARAQAEAANRMKDEFLAMLAHELRNPLAPVRNTLTILRQRHHEDPIALRALEMSERQVRHMARMLDDLLDVSRITRGKIRLQKEIVNLNQALTKAVESCAPLLDSRRHVLDIKLPTSPVFLEADPARLEQITCNILNNAAKYTDPGGHIFLEATQQGNKVIVKIRDTGVGIAPEMLAHVFDLFAQADRTLDRSQGGLGIGLTLVKRLVELHDGVVSVTSEGPGRGSEFVFSLPLLRQDRPSVSGSLHRELDQRPIRRVLVVDDNDDAAETLAISLRMVGHEVQTANNGHDALEKSQRFRPDVVILDIGLPGMNGYEIAAKLRSEIGLPDCALIAVTGYGQVEDRIRSRVAGIAHHLVKPIDFDELENILRNKIDGVD